MGIVHDLHICHSGGLKRGNFIFLIDANIFLDYTFFCIICLLTQALLWPLVLTRLSLNYAY